MYCLVWTGECRVTILSCPGSIPAGESQSGGTRQCSLQRSGAAAGEPRADIAIPVILLSGGAGQAGGVAPGEVLGGGEVERRVVSSGDIVQ